MLALQTPARLNPVQIAVYRELQQNRRMIAGPAGNTRGNPPETKAKKVKLINKSVNHADRAVLGNVIFKPVGK